MAFIDESEIEDWFEGEKEKLNKKLYEASYAKKDVEKAKQQYDVAFSKLLKRYDQEFLNLDKRAERRKRRNAPVLKIKNWWGQLLLNTKKNWATRKERYKKWKFDREYEKLMK